MHNIKAHPMVGFFMWFDSILFIVTCGKKVRAQKTHRQTETKNSIIIIRKQKRKTYTTYKR